MMRRFLLATKRRNNNKNNNHQHSVSPTFVDSLKKRGAETVANTKAATIDNLSNYYNAEDFYVAQSVDNNNKKKKKNDSGKNCLLFLGLRRKCARSLRNLATLLEDWLFLTLLGVLVALCSLVMDMAIEFLQTWHIFFIEVAKANTANFASVATTYSIWAGYMLVLVLASAFFVRRISIHAIGSGIPEMKTILRGVILKEYLTLRTLLSKMIGLTLSLGSGLPIGKEGPFVHIASVVASLLSQCVHSLRGAYANESSSYEMLAAACAVGVSSTFSAPVGGVLFSIEVTAAYFAVRNYWRGFFASTCSTVLFRILRVLLVETEVTVTAFYQTKFPRDAFLPEELPFFSLVGVVCGFLATAFIFLQRRCVLFLRRNKIAKFLFQKHWLIYPSLVALIIGSLTYPEGFGRFIGGNKKFMHAAKDFFMDCTWSDTPTGNRSCSDSSIYSWSSPADDLSHFTTLPCFICTYFLLTILASTLPIPCGIFGPSFVIGAAIGRLLGEAMASHYPNGLRGPNEVQIFPGVYAIVGAAAYTGGVTHTVSVAVIVFELTGQLLHILPVMIAVLIANAICSNLQPSIYDSAIKVKHLPYLPDIPQTSSRFHGILVEQFMTRDVKFFSNSTTNFGQIQTLLFEHSLKAFPIVENDETKTLIGSCSRAKLIRCLDAHVGAESRQQEAATRNTAFLTPRQPATKSHKFSFLELPRKQSKFMKTSSETRIIMPDETAVKVEEGNCVEERRASDCTAAGEAPPTGKKCCVEQTSPEMATKRRGAVVKRSVTIPASLSQSPSSPSDVYSTLGGMFRTLTRFSHVFRHGNEQSDFEVDLVGEERAAWERERLAERVDFRAIGIDPAPFQLVEQTSLFKVHSLFSLLGLNRAYVTKCGRLVGVVALRDLRVVVERVQAGDLVARRVSLGLADSSTIFVELDEDGKTDTNNNEGEKERERKVGEEEEGKRAFVLADKLGESCLTSDHETDILNPCPKVLLRNGESPRADCPIERKSTNENTQNVIESVRLQVQKASEALKGRISAKIEGGAGGESSNPSFPANKAEPGSAFFHPGGKRRVEATGTETETGKKGTTRKRLVAPNSPSSLSSPAPSPSPASLDGKKKRQASEFLPTFVISSSDDDDDHFVRPRSSPIDGQQQKSREEEEKEQQKQKHQKQDGISSSSSLCERIDEAGQLQNNLMGEEEEKEEKREGREEREQQLTSAPTQSIAASKKKRLPSPSSLSTSSPTRSPIDGCLQRSPFRKVRIVSPLNSSVESREGEEKEKEEENE